MAISTQHMQLVHEWQPNEHFLGWSLKNLNHKNPAPKCAPQLCSFLCHASVLMILTENITPVDPLFNLLLDLGAVRSRCLESLGFQKALRAGSVTKRLLDATSAATDGQNSLMKSVWLCLSSLKPLEKQFTCTTTLYYICLYIHCTHINIYTHKVL